MVVAGFIRNPGHFCVGAIARSPRPVVPPDESPPERGEEGREEEGEGGRTTATTPTPTTPSSRRSPPRVTSPTTSAGQEAKLERISRIIRTFFDRVIGWLRGGSGAVSSVEGTDGGGVGGRTPNCAGRPEDDEGRETSPPAVGICESMPPDSLTQLIHLPEGMDREEWIASHVIALFEHVNALRGSISELCTTESCPTMSYPGTPRASWVDERGKKHAYAAPQYMDMALAAAETKVDDPSLFPTRHGQPFPATFSTAIGGVMRLLWHCAGHLRERHWDEIEALNLRPQTMLVMEHLGRFCAEFGLLEATEQKKIDEVINALRPPSDAAKGDQAAM